MGYFLDLFSPETYEAFGRSDQSVSGFRSRHKNAAEGIRPRVANTFVGQHDLAAELANAQLRGMTHPFSEIWLIWPTTGEIPGFLWSVWPSNEFTSTNRR